jgi:hypothetical protein
MGQELDCKARFERRSWLEGKALLETDYVLFRGPERLKITFSELTGVKADSGILTLEYKGGPAELELGAAAEKWARKILNPPTLVGKLGVKAGLLVRLVGEFEPDFVNEVAGRQAVTPVKGKCELLFFRAEKLAQLKRIPKLKEDLKPGAALWVIYPKGVSQITEIQVIQAGRAAGMKDVKVVGFSATHTGLKFM